LQTTLRRIRLAEDSANDSELTLAAHDEHRLATQVDVLRDGAGAFVNEARPDDSAHRP